MPPRLLVRPSAGVVALVLVGLVAIVSGGGCREMVPRPDGARCEGATVEDANACDGEVCLALGDNAQSLPGMCSRRCTATGACESEGVCLGPLDDGEYYCFRSCLDSSSCYDGAVCLPGSVTSFCWVTP
jgi:hypothetical protein